MEAPPTGTLFGLTATDFGTLLAGLATMAVIFALYTVMTVRDPMAKRVKRPLGYQAPARAQAGNTPAPGYATAKARDSVH